MNYGQIKTDFLGQLKRNNVTPSQVAYWINTSIRRAQLLLSIPASNKSISYTVGTSFTSFDIPGDFLKLISLSVNERELKRADLTTVRQNAKFEGWPVYFAEANGGYLLGPRPRQDDVIELAYSANFPAVSADEDTNFLFQFAPHLVIAGAMVEACDALIDPRGPRFEQKFANAIAEFNNQAAEDALRNAVVLPGYSMNFGDD